MASGDARAARRYATALFQAAKAQNMVETIEKDFASLQEMIQAAPAFQQFWLSPLIPSGRKREIAAKLLQNSVCPLTLAFVRLLADKRREAVLTEIPAELRLLADQDKGILRAEATFAVAPTPQEENDIRESLQKRTGKNVTLHVHVDPDILGGVLVRFNDNVLDGSVRGTLERLREHMLQDA